MAEHRPARTCSGPLETCMRAHRLFAAGMSRHPDVVPCGGCGRAVTLARYVPDLGRDELDRPRGAHLCPRCDPLWKGREPR